MALTSRIARPLLACSFVVNGLDAVRDPGCKSQEASVVTEPLRERVAKGEVDTQTVRRVAAGVQVAAGILLGIGRGRRLACLALIGSLVPTTYAAHGFWEETDEVIRNRQRTQFVKNLSLLGGLILAAADTEGEPSFSWRAKRRVRQLERVRAPESTHAPSSSVSEKSQAIAGAASKARRQGIRRARVAGDRAQRAVTAIAANPEGVVTQARDGVKGVHGALQRGLQEPKRGATQAVRHGTALVAEMARHLEPLADSAVRIGADIASEAHSAVGQESSGR